MGNTKINLRDLQQPLTVNTGAAKKKYDRACRDKRRFFSKADTQAVIDRRDKPDLFEAYLCVFCRSWHIGHSRQHYRELRKATGPTVSEKERRYYLRHITRLQERNRLLAEALADERRIRHWLRAEYLRRLRSKFAWVIHYMVSFRKEY